MTELTDRLRTCAEFLRTCDLLSNLEAQNDTAEHKAVSNAIELLIEAAEELEKPIEVKLGEPIEAILPPMKFAIGQHPVAYWIDDGIRSIPNAPISKNACPNCDSRASKTVRAQDKILTLECPVCGHMWKR